MEPSESDQWTYIYNVNQSDSRCSLLTLENAKASPTQSIFKKYLAKCSSWRLSPSHILNANRMSEICVWNFDMKGGESYPFKARETATERFSFIRRQFPQVRQVFSHQINCGKALIAFFFPPYIQQQQQLSKSTYRDDRVQFSPLMKRFNTLGEPQFKVPIRQHH